MKLSEAQKLAEQAIYDYTSSTKWQEVKHMNWTTAEMQDVIAKALVKKLIIPVVVGRSEQLVCSCGSIKVKTTGGSQCPNNRCSSAN